MEQTNEQLLQELRAHLKYALAVFRPYEIDKTMRVPVRRLQEASKLVVELGERLLNDPENQTVKQEMKHLTTLLADMTKTVNEKSLLLAQKEDKIAELQAQVAALQKEVDAHKPKSE